MLLELAFEGNQIHASLALRVLREVLVNVDMDILIRKPETSDNSNLVSRRGHLEVRAQ
jgi:hypothetical protein